MRRLTRLIPLALVLACAVAADTAGEWRMLHDGIYADVLRRSCEHQGGAAPLHFCIGREQAKQDTAATCQSFRHRKPDDIPEGELAALMGAFDYCRQAGRVQ